MDEGLIRLAVLVTATIIELPILIFYIGLRKNERERIIAIAKNKLLKR